MASLFRLLFQRQVIKTRLKNDAAWATLQKRNRLADPGNNMLLYRLPKSELRQLITRPCPVSVTVEKDIVASSKRLRTFLGIKEELATQRCPLGKNCGCLTQTEEEPATLSDVQAVLFGLYDNEPEE
jgi:hypothetical protein